MQESEGKEKEELKLVRLRQPQLSGVINYALMSFI